MSGLRLPVRALARLAVAALLLAAAGPVLASEGRRDLGRDGIEPTVCRDHAEAAERARGIPHQLLAAIALAESGRWVHARKESLAWPWTVTSGENSWYLESKAAAVRKVEELRRRGVRNIDVGCMQINLHYHPDAFADLDAAFEPESNVAYAARFLARLREDKGSWNIAIAHYHSANKARNRPYFEKVYAFWRAERQREFEARQRRAAERREKLRAARSAERESIREVAAGPAEASRPAIAIRPPAAFAQN